MSDDGVYPEHDKLGLVQNQVNALTEFLDEWAPQQDVVLCRFVDSGKRTGFGSEIVMEYQPVFRARDLVYEFLEIDQDEIEVERRRMLDDLRARS